MSVEREKRNLIPSPPFLFCATTRGKILARYTPLFLTIITALKGIPEKHRSRRVFGPRFTETRFHSTLSRRVGRAVVVVVAVVAVVVVVE